MIDFPLLLNVIRVGYAPPLSFIHGDADLESWKSGLREGKCLGSGLLFVVAGTEIFNI